MPRITPVPDATTGEPRPPHAPLNITPKQKVARKTPRRPFAAPSGQGPMLEWHQETPWTSVLTGLGGSLIIAVFAIFKAGGFDWVSAWQAWCFIAAPFIIFFWRGQRGGFAAGADWFATTKKSHVKLYEISEVTMTNPAGVEAWELVLIDEHGGYAGVTLREIQQHQALWDLVYNGVAHSVLRGGASANDRALEMLQLR